MIFFVFNVGFFLFRWGGEEVDWRGIEEVIWGGRKRIRDDKVSLCWLLFCLYF